LGLSGALRRLISSAISDHVLSRQEEESMADAAGKMAPTSCGG
jgi:hypothetical protein